MIGNERDQQTLFIIQIQKVVVLLLFMLILVILKNEQFGIGDVDGLESEEREILLKNGYSDRSGCFSLEELKSTSERFFAEKAPGKPTEEDGFKSKKNWDGKTVKAPNSKKRGYPAKDGGVWVPTGEGSGDGSSGPHGGPHWDVEYPDGSYRNVRPKKK